MIKKLLASLLAITCLCLTGCDDGNQTTHGSGKYTHVHVQLSDKVFHDDVVAYNYKYEGTAVEINTKTYGWIFLNNGFMLYNSDKCPLCNKL